MNIPQSKNEVNKVGNSDNDILVERNNLGMSYVQNLIPAGTEKEENEKVTMELNNMNFNNSNNFQVNCPNCNCTIQLSATIRKTNVSVIGNVNGFHSLRQPGNASYAPVAATAMYESDNDSDKSTNSNKPSTSKSAKSGLNSMAVASTSQPSRNNGSKQLAKLIKIKVEDLNRSAEILILDSNEPIYKLLAQYIKNSYGLKSKFEINAIYSYSPNKNGFNIHSRTKNYLTAVKSSSKSSSQGINDDDFSMLLWYSAPKSAIGKILTNGGLKTRKGRPFLVLYDRAFKVLEKLGQLPIQNGLAILCEVSPGKVHKSPHGISYWSQNKIPNGYDSIKGIGELMPDWNQNVTMNSSPEEDYIIPLGQTIKNQRFPKFELKFNEYIIQHDSAVKIKFIVDLSLSK